MSAAPPEHEPSAARNIYAFGITSFLNDTATEMAYWVLPAFLASLGAGPAQLGLIEGIAESVASFATFLRISGRPHQTPQARRSRGIFRRECSQASAGDRHGVAANSS